MAQSTCPISGENRRKTNYPGESLAAGVEVIDGVWHVRDMNVAREVLRSRDTTQAGFNVEKTRMGHIRPPILFSDGEPHRTQRAAIARYFAPKTVDANYHELMETYADQLVEEFRRDGVVDLAQMSMRYSVIVAAQVVGLTNSDYDAMATRLNRFFDMPLAPAESTPGRKTLRSRFEVLRVSSKAQLPMLDFHLRDVRPAIKARRKERQSDVISHLIDAGYSELEIMIECITYGAAGMVTTREFIGMAVWQMLEHPELRSRYLAGDKAERYQVLHEVLRLDPIVGHLLRRTTAPVPVVVDGEERTIPAGTLVDLYIRNSNADPAVVGEKPLEHCPGRELPPRVGAEVMSFGDGAHKCPGNSLAIQEADVLLQRLLKLPIQLATKPVVQWDELIKGYEVRNIRLVLEQGA
ncbi:cytochrome P450 [Luteococcus sp. Sow4_B9]|uniref:cytochrome P450 n=1 Tax=Luteococcus sp. Sow4_B9 TaxID=3438792 RepID=UPI003F969688